MVHANSSLSVRSNLAEQIKHKVSALHGLEGRLGEMADYLDKVHAGDLPINNEIMSNLQNIMNLFPNLNLEGLIRVRRLAVSVVCCSSEDSRMVWCAVCGRVFM